MQTHDQAMITTPMLIALNKYYNTRGDEADVPYIIEDDDDAAVDDGSDVF